MEHEIVSILESLKAKDSFNNMELYPDSSDVMSDFLDK